MKFPWVRRSRFEHLEDDFRSLRKEFDLLKARAERLMRGIVDQGDQYVAVKVELVKVAAERALALDYISAAYELAEQMPDGGGLKKTMLQILQKRHEEVSRHDR